MSALRWLGAWVHVPRWVPILLAVKVIGDMPESIEVWGQWLS